MDAITESEERECNHVNLIRTRGFFSSLFPFSTLGHKDDGMRLVCVYCDAFQSFLFFKCILIVMMGKQSDDVTRPQLGTEVRGCYGKRVTVVQSLATYTREDRETGDGS